MSNNPYKLSVEVRLLDKTNQGADTVAKTLEKMQDRAKALQHELQALGVDPEKFKIAENAQRKVNDLTKIQADLRKKLALSTDKEETQRISVELEALKLTKDQINAKKSALTLDEKNFSWIYRATRMQQAEDLRKERADEAKTSRLKRFAAIEERNDQRRILDAQRADDQYWKQRGKAVEDHLNGVLSARQANAKESESEGGERHAGFAGRIASSFIGNLGARLAGDALGALSNSVNRGFSDTADLQQLLTTMKVGTGASNSQVDQFRQTAFDISNLTAQDATQSAHLMAVMAQSGLNKPEQLIKLAPLMAQFADVQYYKKGTPFEDSATQAVQLAHLYGAVGTSPKDIDRFQQLMERFTQISFMMPDNLNKYLTQAGYYMPAFRHFGISDDQSLVMGAFLDRMGLGKGKGGTSLANFVQNQLGSLAISGHVEGKRAEALQKLGLLNNDGTSKFYNNGHFDVFGSLQQIDNDARELTRGLKGHALDAKNQEVAKYIQAALGVQGGRIGFLGSDDALKVLHDMVDALRHAPSLKQDQSSYLNNLGPSFQRATSNLRSVAVEALWPSLGVISSFFNDVGTAAHKFQVLLHKNKSVSLTLAEWWTQEQSKIVSSTAYGFGYMTAQFVNGLTEFVGNVSMAIADVFIHPLRALRGLGGFFGTMGAGVDQSEREYLGSIKNTPKATLPSGHTIILHNNFHAGTPSQHADAVVDQIVKQLNNASFSNPSLPTLPSTPRAQLLRK